MTTVAISGAAGRMGHASAAAIVAAPDLDLVGCFDPGHPGDVVGGLEVSADPAVFEGADVVLEWAPVDTVLDRLPLHVGGPRHVVVGSSGFTAERLSAAEAGVHIIAGDTKVVERGKADGLYINTAGVGQVWAGAEIGGDRARPGDVVILSGSIGDHGIAVLEARGELGFQSDVTSDVAPLNHLVEAMLATSKKIHVLRDPTRGGVASSLNEIAAQSQVGILLNESTIPIRPAVQAACEMLGFDPLYIANEGKLLAIVAEEDATAVLETMRQTRYGEESVVIGRVEAEPKARVLMKTAIGTTRIVDMLAGEMLPRIC